MASNEELQQLIREMQLQREQDKATMNELLKQFSLAISTNSKGNSGSEFIIESLAASISEFTYDPENGSTFDAWYSRFEDVFKHDASKLDDSAKVRLLLRKINTVSHNKYINFILPKKPSDFNFDDTVNKLTQLFGLHSSLFNIRFKCLQNAKDESIDFITYAGLVNKQCEEFKLNDMTLDQFKCLIFVIGLKSSSDLEIRTRLLAKIESEKDTISLEKLSNECIRLINLKRDTSLIENPEAASTTVQKVTRSDSGKHHREKKSEAKQHKQQAPKTPCWHCGQMHFSRDCTYNNHECNLCKRTGHKEGYCNAPTKKSQKKNKKSSSKSSDKSAIKGIPVQKLNLESKRKFVTVKINGKPIQLQYDSGADITVMSEDNFNKLGFSNLAPATITAQNASGDNLNLIGEFYCEVSFKSKTIEGKCFVSKAKNLNVLGTDFIDSFNLWDIPVNEFCDNATIKQICQQNYPNQLKQQFPRAFQPGLGLCTKSKARLTLKENVQPVFKPKRPVAYAMQHLVEEELQRLQNIGVITPITCSDWAAPIVVTRKANGEIRICADYSTGLNKALESHQYPLPLPQDIFAKLAGATVFSHIDLADAFFQVPIDENSDHLLVINTHLGLFKYNRLNFGVKTAPATFQEIIDQMIAGLNGVAAYIDDIFVSGKDQNEHDQNMKYLFQRIVEFGFIVKLEKCKFALSEINYLGYTINKDGLRPDPNRVKAIDNMPEPTNITELRSFLGAINFYGKFVKQMRSLRGPLDNLLKSNIKWKWNNECHNSFIKLKEILSSDITLTHYNPTQEIIVAADASNYGLGACIMHRFADGTIKPICHASRSLQPAERAYSQIEKEALALIFAVTKFHKLIFGQKIILQTDHKPLLAIFGRKNGIPTHAANRLQRWAVILLAYDFEIEYINTNSFGYADVLSRLIKQNVPPEEDFVIATIKMEAELHQILESSFNHLPVTSEMIKVETRNDSQLNMIASYTKTDWPDNFKSDDPDTQQLYKRKSEISIVNGCLLLGDRIIVPKRLRTQILNQLHKDHSGMDRMKAMATSHVYWPTIDKQIEKHVRECDKCAAAGKSPTKTLLRSWPIPSGAWQRVHIDYAGPIQDNYFLIIVDAFSKWPEIIPTKSISSNVTIEILRDIFARFGAPIQLVSDNGTQFTLKTFENFCKCNGITHTTTSPYHPMSNGQAERFVDTFKRAMRKLEGEGTMRENIHTFLQRYRATPNRYAPNQKSPSELLLGRMLRTELDLLNPNTVTSTERNITQENQFNRKHGAKLRQFETGDKVHAKVYRGSKFQWKSGHIIERVGNVMYNVQLDKNGFIIRSHTNQLKMRANAQELCDKFPLQTLWDVFESYDNYDPPVVVTNENQNDMGEVPGNNVQLETVPEEINEQLTHYSEVQPTRRSCRSRSTIVRYPEPDPKVTPSSSKQKSK